MRCIPDSLDRHSVAVACAVHVRAVAGLDASVTLSECLDERDGLAERLHERVAAAEYIAVQEVRHGRLLIELVRLRKSTSYRTPMERPDPLFPQM
eukprot:CAMPEP_0119414328 /NCGR_PEP_ID=MMETSP1335-20130426/6804_1 /TAXON_ID=259385 /ORGANISM="Chrysoculter rhomboideus, Strain RCC1486" /LENGTH=94 /DNA_ID=CAMNT_0007439201 /DNA_START=367 /DNA_END=652 /DNA_ORIENTATION=-